MPTSLSLSTGCSTFARRTDHATISNCFYTSTLGEAQGTQGYTVTNGQPSDMTLDYGSGNNYGSITAYSFDQGNDQTAGGLLYDDKLYTGGTTKVIFTPEADNGQQPTLSASNGETIGNNGDGTYTLTMASANTTVTATSYSDYTVTLYDGGSTDTANTTHKTNGEIISGHRNHIADVTLSGRTLYQDNSWNTLCLPFNMTAEQVASLLGDNGTLMELDVTGTYDTDKQTGFSDGTLYLYFKNALTITAGKPYIIKWTSGTDFTPTFTGITINSFDPEAITSTDGKVSFVGNFDPVPLTAGDKTVLYLGTENKLYYAAESSTDRSINAFRGYFQLNNGLTAGTPQPEQQQVRAFVLNFGDDGETTGIVGVEHGIMNIEHSAAAGWYDLSGRKLSGKPTKKGIYIYNGKKRVIK